jgi:hypothetical protein
VFGSRVLGRYEPGLTLLDATQRNDDVGSSAFAKLVKHASAALLNAYARDGFPFDSWEVLWKAKFDTFEYSFKKS